MACEVVAESLLSASQRVTLQHSQAKIQRKQLSQIIRYAGCAKQLNICPGNAAAGYVGIPAFPACPVSGHLAFIGCADNLPAWHDESGRLKRASWLQRAAKSLRT
jgi:hypothetical protein